MCVPSCVCALERSDTPIAIDDSERERETTNLITRRHVSVLPQPPLATVLMALACMLAILCIHIAKLLANRLPCPRRAADRYRGPPYLAHSQRLIGLLSSPSPSS